MPWHVFYSHATADKAYVKRVKAVLDAAGLNGWIDANEMEGGEALFGKIAEGIYGSEVVLLFLSPTFVTREN
jgi:hypothetical protein